MNSESLQFLFIASYVFIFGLCSGSFLNVAILRGLSGEDMVFSRSKCPKCENQLKWYMNIPLLSYLFLRGKCAFCKEPISFQYPLVEFICGVSFLVSFLVFGLSLKTLFICIFLALFILLSATDFKETVIIDYHAYILLGFGLLYSFLKLGEINVIQSVIGAIGGFLFFEIISRIGKLLIKARIFGEGDSLIALGLGAIFGFKNLLILILVSFLIQTIMAVPMMIKAEFQKKKYRLAFTYVIVFLSMIGLACVKCFNLIKDDFTYMLFVIGISLILLFTLKNIIGEIAQKRKMMEEIENQQTNEQEDEQDVEFENIEKTFYLMPFGPALIFAGVLCIFYLPQVKECIKNFIF